MSSRAVGLIVGGKVAVNLWGAWWRHSPECPAMRLSLLLVPALLVPLSTAWAGDQSGLLRATMDPAPASANMLVVSLEGPGSGGEGALFVGALAGQGLAARGLVPGALTQDGLANRMHVTIAGAGTLAAFAQAGQGNVITATVQGSGNQVAIEQVGDGNSAAIVQMGNGNTIGVFQGM
ncbi:hypothetical protein [Zavarzinia sp. CC-PAN008]|uniref:hypothetical protein n=1 Tax=Zavarzinia sp. CC-PAN008 TaxID=3243332 RepID=UPI003F744736